MCTFSRDMYYASRNLQIHYLDILIDMTINVCVCSGEDIVNESRDRAQEFFGVSHPTIQNLIQGLPGASSCASYRWLRFEECKPEERAKIAHWYESDPTVCYDGLQSAYQKRMGKKNSNKLSHQLKPQYS